MPLAKALTKISAFLAFAGAMLVANSAFALCQNPDALGVSRRLALDTSGGFTVGSMQNKPKLPLADMEVVLTFDDGPSPETTEKVLAALDAECAKATFFIVGAMAHGYPATLRLTAASGHTIGTHTQNHRLDLQTQPFEVGAAEIDRGIAEITKVLGEPPAPFFRFPGLGATKAMTAKLEAANIGIFSADVVGDDWLVFTSDRVRELVLERLTLHHGGIVLLHDTKRATAAMLPQLLRDLKQRGFRLVQIVPGGPEVLVSSLVRIPPSIEGPQPAPSAKAGVKPAAKPGETALLLGSPLISANPSKSEE